MIIQFTYTAVKIPTTVKQLKSRTKSLELGQLNLSNALGGENGLSLNKRIYYKHYYENDSIYRYADDIGLLSINAPKGATFVVQTGKGSEPEIYIVDDTGSLSFEDTLFVNQITYVGITKNSVLDKAATANITVNYQYTEYFGYFKY